MKFLSLMLALITVVPAQQRLGKKITLLVDTSASMIPHYQKSLEMAQLVLEQAVVDEVEVKLRTFGHESKVTAWQSWPLNIPKMVEWLTTNGANTGQATYIAPALEAALTDGDVIIISDFAIHDMMAAKIKEGRVVSCILVGSLSTESLPNARRLQQGGGIYRDDAARVPKRWPW